MHLLTTAARALAYDEAERLHREHLAHLAAEAERAERQCLTGLLLLFALACCCA